MKKITSINEIKDFTFDIYTRKKKLYSDTIYTYDIETTSLFKIDNEYKEFDYSKTPNFYRDKEKVALPYISQFSIENKYYYFRDFYLFTDILKKISDSKLKKIIFVHNLSFEFTWLLNIIYANGWSIVDTLCRKSQSVICFTIKELNIEFRCSYCLTNLSLEKCAEEYECKSRKQIGSLDYNKARSPLSALSAKELKYCKFDLVVMYEFLSKFRHEYKHVQNIPYTQTGEVRRYLIENFLDYYYVRKMQNLVAQDWEYPLLMQAFWGAITHANYIHANKVIRDVGSWDYSSDYPFQLCCEKYPCENFFEIAKHEIELFKKSCCMIYDVTLIEVNSKLKNHYIPFSKCEECLCGRFDNGRIIKAKKIVITITDVDFEMIQKSYKIQEIKINHVYAAHKKYLDRNMILGILSLYERKTQLKNIDEMLFSYNKSKQKINGCFGCACTNIMKQRNFINLDKPYEIWDKEEFNLKFIQKKILEAKQSHSTLFQYSTGVWCTAYARKALWDKIVIPCDNDICYYDTDSGKLRNYKKYEHLIDEINRKVYEKCMNVAKYHDIDFDMFQPYDKDGKQHLLGKLEFEGIYDEFKTLGAKKYAYRDEKGLHITVSGVKKSAVDLLNDDINNFRDGFVFGYEAKKLMIAYNYEQKPFSFKDCDGNVYECNDIQYAVIMQPTTYRLSNSVDASNALDKIESEDFY